MSWARWENNKKCHYKMEKVVFLDDFTEWERTKMLSGTDINLAMTVDMSTTLETYFRCLIQLACISEPVHTTLCQSFAANHQPSASPPSDDLDPLRDPLRRGGIQARGVLRAVAVSPTALPQGLDTSC